MPPTPKLEPRSTYVGENFWCLPCCEVWYESVNDNLKTIPETMKREIIDAYKNGNPWKRIPKKALEIPEKEIRKAAFDKAGDPWKKIKSFSSSEDLKKHIKTAHIFSKQKYDIVCPMQGCNETNVDVRHHMKVFHGVDEDDDENWLGNYCREPDSKNGICGCRFHVNNDCDEDILPCQSRHHLRHHGLGLWPLRDAESVYRRIPDILNPWE